MKRAILDAEIFTEVVKGRNAAVAATAKSYRAAFAQFTVLAVTVMEIVQSMHKRGQAAGVQRFLELADASEILEIDRKSAEIADVALRYGLVLVTADANHLRRIAELDQPLELDN